MAACRELQPCKSSNVPKFDIHAFYSHLQVTSSQMTSLPGHFQSRDIISCYVTATSCEFQPCRSWNVPKTWLIHLQLLPVDFRSNDVTSGTLPVMWGPVTSFPATWWPLPASFSPVGVQRTQNSTYAFYSHFQVTCGHMTSLPSHFRSRDVISCHVTATSCELQPCRS